MKTKKIRKRVILLALMMTLLTEGIVLGIACVSGIRITGQVQKGYDAQQFQNIYDYANSMMNDMQVLKSVLINPDYSEYITQYWSLKDENNANAAREVLNDRINKLGLSSDLVKDVFMLGYSDSQRSFIKEIGDNKWKDEELPYYFDFFYSSIDKTYFDFLFSNNPGLQYVAKGEIQKQLPLNGGVLYNRVVKRFNNLAGELEGNIVLSNSYTPVARFGNNTGVVIIVINPGFLKEYLQGNNAGNEKITLLDKSNRIVWTNLDKLDTVNPFTNISATDGETSLDISGKEYQNRFKTLGNGNFKLVYSIPANVLSSDIFKLIAVFTAFLLASTAIILFIVYYFSNVVSMPLKKLTDLIRRQVRINTLEKINTASIPKNLFSRLSINRRIFYTFLISLLLAIFSSAIFTYRYIYDFAGEVLGKTATAASSNMYKNMSHLMYSYYLDSELIPFNEIERILQTGYSSKALATNIETVLVAQPLNLYYFANVVLLDSSGNVRYQSIYPNNPQLLAVPLNTINEDYEKQEGDIFWESIPEDIFNQPSIAVVRKIYSSGNNAKPDGKPIGYMELFLHGNPFQSLHVSLGTDFLIFNSNNNMIYSSISDQDGNYSKTDLAIFKDGKMPVNKRDSGYINNMKYLFTYGTLPQKGWNIVVLQKFDSINAISQQLIYSNLITAGIMIILALILSWRLARYVAKPVELIGNSMERVGDGDFSKPDINSSYDEISELIYAYNRMVEQIDTLMQENLRRQTREHELVILNARSELNMLQQQINPHFLYNSLEMINMQAIATKDTKISTMASALSRLFRYAIKNEGMTVSLEKEIEHAKNYISIQSLRFKDKFTASWNIEPSALEIPVIKFILQPIIENSINHGLYNVDSGGIIEVTAKRDDEKLYLEIRDNGTGIKKAELDRVKESLRNNILNESALETDAGNEKSTGIALKNVYKRLYLHYQGKAEMTIESEYMYGTKVLISIQIN